MSYQLALDPLTWDSVVAVGLFLLAVGGAGVAFLYRRTEPGRTYDLTFEEHPWTVTAERAAENAPSQKKVLDVLEADEGEAHVRIKAKKPAFVRDVTFRLVERMLNLRLFGIWRWECPKGVFVTNLWDAEWEVQRELAPAAPPVGRSPLAGGTRLVLPCGYKISYSEPDSIRQDESLWYRVIIRTDRDWSGHLEFCGETADGKVATTHRSISLRFVPDYEGRRRRRRAMREAQQ